MLRPTVSKTDSAPLHYNRGLDLAASGKVQQAIIELRVASRLDLKDADALCEIGRLEIDEGRLLSAARILDEALSRDSRHAAAMNNRGVVNFLSGRFEEAAACFRSAVNFNPEMADAWFNLADTCEELGMMDERDKAHLRFRALRGK